MSDQSQEAGRLLDLISRYWGLAYDQGSDGRDPGVPDFASHLCLLKIHDSIKALAHRSAADPIDMVLHCPACGLQHIDAVDIRKTKWQVGDRALTPTGIGTISRMSNPNVGYEECYFADVELPPGRFCFRDSELRWPNEQHRSHLCHGCNHIWRPADVPTNGVLAVKTVGKADSPIATRPTEAAVGGVPTEEQLKDCIRALGYTTQGQSWDLAKAVRAMLAAAPTAIQPIAKDAAQPEHHKLDNDRQVFFYEQDFYVLSNFSAFNLRWHGHTFQTSEHAYHWNKFAPGTRDARGDFVRDSILDAPSAHEAFKIAERNKHLRRIDWDQVKVDAMREVLRAKAKQHEYVRRKLLATGSRELIEDSWRDDYWGRGPNRDGKNMLGKLWMEVRAELAATPPPTAIAEVKS